MSTKTAATELIVFIIIFVGDRLNLWLNPGYVHLHLHGHTVLEDLNSKF